MAIIIAVFAIIVVNYALYGWGLVVRRLFKLPAGTWPITVALGLAGWIFLGGILNVLRLAYPWALYVLLAVGVGITAASLRAARASLWNAVWPKTNDERVYRIILGCLTITILCFTLFTQLSPSAFNQHDDYQKYFVHVARMVQTGTLYGSPLNTLGSETLGGQAFLQSLAVAHLPIAYINAADAVFCFILTILLAGAIAWGRSAVAPVAILAILVLWLFEPQYANITALYSAAALMFAIVSLSVDQREYAADGADFPPPAVMGLMYAAVVALKSTFALFVSLHFLACVVATIAATGKIGSNVKRAIATGTWGLAFILPWVALYSPLYWSAIVQPAAGFAQMPEPFRETINFLLSTKPLFFGGSYVQYTFAAVVPLICAGIKVTRRQWSSPDAARFVGVCGAIPLAYLVMILVIGPQLAGHNTALRHVIPVLIGTIPATLIYSGLVTDRPELEKSRPYNVLTSMILAAVLVVWFMPDAFTRARVLIRTGTMLVYIRNWPPGAIESLLTFSRQALQGNLRQRVAEQQQRVPAGAPLLVWTAAPFLLDFTRNPIVDVDIGGLATPWSRTPPVSYILWQYAGFGVRQQPDDYAVYGPGRREAYLAVSGLAYVSRLRYLLTRSQIVFNDGQTVLMRRARDATLP